MTRLRERDEAVGRRELGTGARAARLIGVGAVLVALLAGSFFGSDDDFPLGPFHMYSSRGDPNAVARELRVQVVTASGRTIDVTNESGAPRRAELEGRIGELQHDTAELERIAPLYTAHISEPVRQFRLVWENHPLHNGRTAAPYYTVIVSIAV